MRQQNLAEELAEVRLTLARLRRRERLLEHLVEQAEPAKARLRPGWPIQRTIPAEANTH
jgi:hypothetical protein